MGNCTSCKRDRDEIKAANNEIQSAIPNTSTPTLLSGESSSYPCSLILSEGDEEEEEEILNKETLDSIKGLNEAMKRGNVDVKHILDRLHAVTNNLKSGNQQFKTEAPSKEHGNRFDELINKHMKYIVDRLVAFKKTGIPKQLSKLTAKLLEGVGKRNSVLVVVSFLGWTLNRGLEIPENDKFCMKFLEYIKCLLNLLHSHMTSLEGDTPSDSPITHIAQEITNGILVCCIYLDDLKQVSDFLDNAIQNFKLQLSLENNQKLKSLRTTQYNVPQSVHAVGIDDRIAAVIESLEIENDRKNGVAVILHGYAGIGKSTLGASVLISLYENPMFKFSVASVTVSSDEHDTTVQALKLQKQIIHQLLTVKYKVTSVEAGKEKLEKIFRSCPCFLFVDNIVNANQLSHLLPDLSDCSDYMLRILVTSRDLEVRSRMPFREDLIKSYYVGPLPNHGDCVMLLREKAGLKDAELDDKEKELITEIANLCHGFPIMLSLVGKDLKFHRQQEGYYAKIIKKLEVADYRDFDYNRDIKKVLLSVFTLVDEITQKAFLDICFFFCGWDWDKVRCIIGNTSMDKLAERSMIHRSHDDKVIVHSILKAIAMDKARKQKTRSIIKIQGIERVTNEEDEKTSENAEEEEIIIEAEKLEISEIILNLDPSQDLQKIEALFIYGDARKEVLIDPKRLPSLRLFRSCNTNVKFETNSDASDFNQLQFLEINQKAWGNVQPLLSKIKNHFSRMEVLSLNSFEDLHKSPAGMSKFKQLKRLDLSSASLRTLPPEIEALKYLEFLSLAGCHGITDLPENLGALKSLLHLKLQKCEELVYLPPHISGLQDLRTLKMASCQKLQSLPKEIGSLRCLEHLDLSSCEQLKSLPPEFGDLTNLKSIEMSNCTGIEDLPNEMGKLASLEELKLIGCSSLKSLPSEFGNLTNLKSIDMSNCTGIEDLPNEMGMLISLEELKLTGCSHLKCLPLSVSGLLKLKKLEMDYCDNIETLPEDIGMLASLEYLLIDSKKLQRLPSSFQGLTSLKRLHIRCEALESLPEDIGMVASLKELVLIDCSTLQGLPSSVSGLKGQLDMLVIRHCKNITAHQVIEAMNDHTIEHFEVC